MGIPEDIELLSRNIDKLRTEYDQFFLGNIKVPPNTIQTAVERIIRKYIGGGINNTAHRIQYQNLVSRYNSLSELWKRRMRMKEEGIMIGAPAQHTSVPFIPPPPPPQKAKPVEAARPKAPQDKEKKPAAQTTPAEKPQKFSATTREPQAEKHIVASIYSEYVKAQQKAGGPAKSVSQDGFMKLIAKQVETIKKTHKCDAVNFRVDIVDGEVKLKAKPVK